MKYVFVSGKCFGSVIDLLKNLSYKPILINDLPSVDKRISYHSDMSLCVIGDSVVCAPSAYHYLKQKVDCDLVCGRAEPQSKYPEDVLYNAAVVGKYLFCLKGKTDEVLIETAEKKGLEVICVKQGYARCSILPVSDTAVITADSAVSATAAKLGLDVLLVSNNGIFLPGFSHGFIGGTGGTVGKNVVFFGDISKHPDYSEIKAFCSAYGKSVKYTLDRLTDFGSVLC